MKDAPEISLVEGQRLDISGLMAGFITGLPQLFFPIIAVLFGVRSSGKAAVFIPFVIVTILGFSLLFRWLAWTRFRYHIGAEDIRIESGILSRSARSIPFERIQDVSIEQKPIARMFGLGEVKFETGSGAGDEGKLSYVSITEAERLRDLVRAHKAGTKSEFTAAASCEPEREGEPLYAMDIQRVLTLGFYSFSLVIFAVLGGAAQQFDFLLPFDLWDIGAWLGLAEDRGVTINGFGTAARVFGVIFALSGLLFIGFMTGIIRTTLREYGFRLQRTDKGFRRRRGLLTLTDVIMPVHRVQAAIIQTGPIRKRRGWHALKFVSLAGDSGGKKKDESDHVVAPLATINEIKGIASEAAIALPDASIKFIPGRAAWWIIQGLISLVFTMVGIIVLLEIAEIGSKALLVMILLLLLAVILWLDWRHNHYAIDQSQLYVRHGWWNQKLTISAQIKLQSVEISQGPIARMMGLAKLHLGLAGGSLQIVALPLATAHLIRTQLIDSVVRVDYSELNQSA